MPEGVAGAGGGGADVGMAVVAVDAPGVEDALKIDELVPGTAQVIHDLLVPSLHECGADAPRDVVQHLVPGDALPLAVPARADAAKRVEDAFGILHLVQGRGPLGAVSAAAARMPGVALELPDIEVLLVHVSEKPAGCLAVEADGRHQRVAPGHAARPSPGVELFPVAPAIDGGIAIETAGRRIEVARVRVKRLRCRAGREVRHAVLTI